MLNEVVYLRLMNSEQITARLVDEQVDTYTVVYPMLIENKAMDGVASINLVKYLPFSTDQHLTLKKEHVISLTFVNTSFEQYYYNSVHYHAVHIQPETDSNLLQINRTLENVLSEDNRKFTAIVKKNAKRIPEQLSNKVH